MKNKKPNAIFISFNDAYFHYAKSCLHSLLQNYPGHPDILIDYQGRSESIIQYLSTISRSKQISINNSHKFDLGIIQSPIIYNRFYLWSDIFSEYNNILHLDVDTLVLKPLDELMDFDEFWIAEDNHPDAKIFLKDDNLFYKSLDVESDHLLELKLAEDGIKIDSRAITMGNAGVFLIPPAYRTEKYYCQLLAIAERYHLHCTYADQSIISIWCYFNEISINNDFRFNCQIRFLGERSPLTVKDIAVIHFTGQSKSVEYYSRLAEREKSIHNLFHQLRQHFRLPRHDSTYCNKIVDKLDGLIGQTDKYVVLQNDSLGLFGLDKVVSLYINSIGKNNNNNFYFCFLDNSLNVNQWVGLLSDCKVILIIDETCCNRIENVELFQFVSRCYMVICSRRETMLRLKEFSASLYFIPTAIDTLSAFACEHRAKFENSDKVLIVHEGLIPTNLPSFNNFPFQYEFLRVDNLFSDATVLLLLERKLSNFSYAFDFTEKSSAWVLMAALKKVIVFGFSRNDYLRCCFPYTITDDIHSIRYLTKKLLDLKSNIDERNFILDLALARVEKYNPASLHVKLSILLDRHGSIPVATSIDDQYFSVARNIVWASGKCDISVSKHEFVVFTLVKNGEDFIPEWLGHYQSLGAKHFFIVDNMSTDKTCDLFLANSNVTIFKTDLEFRLYENDIRNYMVSRYCHRAWCLSVDIDEFFDFPFSNTIGMSQFLEYQNLYGYTAVLAYMQDMVPGENQTGNFIIDHDHIDNQMTSIGWYTNLSKTYCKYNQFNPDTTFCYGGVRSQCFNGDQSQTLLLKHTLTFQDGLLDPHTDPHFCDKARISDVGCVLLHYKFTDFFAPVISERASQNIFNYYSKKHYQHYEKFLVSHVINASDSVTPYKGVMSLVDAGFINISDNYKQFIHNQSLLGYPAMQTPLISCLCVTSNRAHKLKKAIACFYAQTYPSKELVVLCDPADRKTLDVLDQFASDKLKVFLHTNMNSLPIGQLRNISIAKASGEYICTWDDDDWYNIDRLQIQYDALNRHKKAACILSKIFILDSVNGASYLAYHRLWENSLLVNRLFLLEHNIQYPAVRMGEDYLLVDKLVEANAIYPLEEPMLYIYRVSGQNTWPVEHFNHVTKKCTPLTEYQHIVLKKAFDDDVSPEEAAQKIYSNYFLSSICYVELTEEPRP